MHTKAWLDVPIFSSPTVCIGHVTTLAGGRQGATDGIAREAQFFHPTGLTFDAVNNTVYITDQVLCMQSTNSYATLICLLSLLAVQPQGTKYHHLRGKDTNVSTV